MYPEEGKQMTTETDKVATGTRFSQVNPSK